MIGSTSVTHDFEVLQSSVNVFEDDETFLLQATMVTVIAKKMKDFFMVVFIKRVMRNELQFKFCLNAFPEKIFEVNKLFCEVINLSVKKL